ncbi:MAG: hypothetical protein HOI95_19745 [Chromatiales bacterium]|jgi:invasion protein IalB|nr:hypothetical protein [Chromatiales bacterium]
MQGQVTTVWRNTLIAIASLACFTAANAATAPGKEQMLGSFNAWKVMAYDDSGRVCSMWTDSSAGAKPPKAHAFIAHRAATKSYHEVSVQLGVTLKPGSAVNALIGKQRFTLYVDGDMAWNPSSAEDRRMVKAMRAGAKLEVTGQRPNGAPIAATYSLSGFTAAHKRLNSACKVKF